MKKLVLIKIGGGLITDKTKPFTVREDMMKAAAEGILLAVEKFPDYSFIVGNGAGSFGHFVASQSSTDPEERIRAIHESVVTLNGIFTRHLRETGLKTESVVPSEYITAKNGSLVDFNATKIEEALERNTIPVLFGDIVADDTDRGMIFSTEMLLEILADKFHGQYTLEVLYVGEAEGVLDKDATVIPMISSESWGSMGSVIEAPKGYDVTGGMLHKVESALQMTQLAEHVIILSGKDPQNISAALSGAYLGTKVVS